MCNYAVILFFPFCSLPSLASSSFLSLCWKIFFSPPSSLFLGVTYPTVFYRWQKQFFEHGARTFDGVEKIKDSSQEEKILALEQKLQTKNEVLSELMEEHIKHKKTLEKF